MSEMPPAQVSEENFLRAIWGEATGYAELTSITREGTVKSFGFTYPDSLTSLIDAAKRHNEHANIYMGVCLRRETWPRKNSKGVMEFRGTEENTLSAGVVWAEFDFSDQGHKGKTVTSDEARKALKEFPLKPSIVIRSGGGIQVYWLLKEPVIGTDLSKIKAINKAVAKLTGADPSATDLARILRIPWTMNLKYDPTRRVEISFWRPEYRYAIDDFDFLALEKEAATHSVAVSSEAVPNNSKYARKLPDTDLDADTCSKVGKLFAEVWYEGWRHEMALCVSGWLAFSGISLESAKAIIGEASTVVKGNTDKRLKDVEDTYRAFMNGGDVKGKPSLEAMISEGFPEATRPTAKKILDAIHKLISKKKPEKKTKLEPDFKIRKLVKFTSQPARWKVTIEKDGKEFVTSVEHTKFIRYDLFAEEVCDQNTIVPEVSLKTAQWRQMINDAVRNGLYEEREAPLESRPNGAIERGLEDFLSDIKINPDYNILKKYAGCDDENIFFIIKTLKDVLTETGYKYDQNHLISILKEMKWNSAPRRFGKKVIRVWQKPVKEQTEHAMTPQMSKSKETGELFMPDRSVESE